MNKIQNFGEFINEKWEKNVKIHSTGEHADKNIGEIDDELDTLKKRSKRYQDEGKKVPRKIRERESELNFAKRAKQGWK